MNKIIPLFVLLALNACTVAAGQGFSPEACKPAAAMCEMVDGGSFRAIECPNSIPASDLEGCTGAGGPGNDPGHVVLCCTGTLPSVQ